MPMYNRTTYLPTPNHLPSYLPTNLPTWYCMCLPACGRGFESQSYHLRFFQFVLGIEIVMRKGRKSIKEAGICP